MKTFNKKAHYPFTYGDKNADEVMLSDSVVKLMKTKRFQSNMTTVFFALLALGSYAQPSSAIPPEYGEAANEILNQAAQNVAAGGVPAPPPIGQIQGQVPVAPANQQFVLPAMPIDQQHIIGAQQAGKCPQISRIGPTSPPAFYIPDKPRLGGPLAANTFAFTTALRIICLNAPWGKPVAIMMFSSGLVGIASGLSKHFTSHVVINDEFTMSYHGFKKK